MAITNVYVDGFNLYHGAKELLRRESTPQSWKWLDLRALATRLAPRDEIKRVRYFTAHVKAVNHDPQMQQRQQTYLRALRTLPGLSIHLGQFKREPKRMPLVTPPALADRDSVRALGVDLKDERDGNCTVRVWKTEEKGSDVNLAAYLMLDAFRADFEKALVISNDTDLCEPIRLVVEELGPPVIVVNPRGHVQSAAELQKVATETRLLRVAAVVGSQFNQTVHDAVGPISRPEGW